VIIKAGVQGQEVLHLTSYEALEMIECLAAQLKQQQTDIAVTLFHYDADLEMASSRDDTELDDTDTEPKKSDIWIRNFGNDTRCSNKKQLKKVLSTKYKSISVSVRFEALNGKKRVVHVFVDAYGIIRDPEQNYEIVDFNTLFDTQL
jgi:hypothetical protein